MIADVICGRHKNEIYINIDEQYFAENENQLTFSDAIKENFDTLIEINNILNSINEQIYNIQNILISHQQIFESINNEITNIQNTITTQQQEISNIQDTLATQQQEIETINEINTNQTNSINTINENLNIFNVIISKLDNFNDLNFATYSPYYVVSSLRTLPVHGELNYLTTNNKLYKYNAITSSWLEIDWVNAVKATPEWIAQKLRINSTNGKLEITNNNSNWYECYPLYGTKVYNIKTFDTTDYSYKYYLPVGSIATLYNCNHFPFTFIYNNVYTIQYEAYPPSNESTLFLYLNATTTTVYNTVMFRDDSTHSSGVAVNGGIQIGQTSTNRRTGAIFTLSNAGDYIHCYCTYKHYAGTYGDAVSTSGVTASSSWYWLGTTGTTSLSNVRYYIQATIQRIM